MGKYISGKVKCEIWFNDVYVEDGQDEVDAIFPNGWEGEMMDSNLDINSEEFDENDEE